MPVICTTAKEIKIYQNIHDVITAGQEAESEDDSYCPRCIPHVYYMSSKYRNRLRATGISLTAQLNIVEHREIRAACHKQG